MSDAKAKITLGGDTAIELDVLKGTLGQDVIDIRSLGSKGVFTFDPGFQINVFFLLVEFHQHQQQ